MGIKKNFVIDAGLEANLASTFANTLAVTGVASFTNTVSVGSNVSLTTSALSIGNATANVVINSTAITASGGSLTVGTITAGNTTITGNLTVTGTTTYVNTSILNVADNFVTLNADVTGVTAPSENAGIEVNRGSLANVQFMWDESIDRWSTNNQPLVARLQGYTEAVTTNTAVGSTYTIDLSTANIFDLTLTSNVTFSVSNPPSSGIGMGATIIIRQDATGSRRVTFPNSFKWTDGVNANTYMSTGANKIDVISIFTVDGGTVYLASQAMANVG